MSLVSDQFKRGEVKKMKKIQRYWDSVALTLILLLAGFLSIFNIWNLGYSNEFYAASVKSMLTSWKNFFFVSLDPGGWVTVDKPPVSLWVQTAFAKVFGFYGWSIILPQCLAAVAAVAVIHHVVKRHFGSAAGLVSALVLALSPIFIVVSKTNNTDSVLILFMVLSAWAMMVASDRGQLRYLLLSMVLLGIAYNAKTLEAFLILPALYAVYFFGTNLKWGKRLGHLALATLVLAVVSLSWSVIVDLTPASERPYVDNSTNNSELELALGYNGIQRLTGQSGNSGKGSAQRADRKFGGAEEIQAGMPNQSGMPSQSGAGRPDSSSAGDWGSFRQNGTAGFQGGNGMFNGGGSAGILRMFNTTLGGQDSWLLPLGLFSILALLLGMRKSSGADGETRRKLLRSAILWGGSVITMVGYFSVAQFFHPYYISALAPFLAALVGIGLTELWKLYRTGGPAGWLLPLSLFATLGGQIAMLLSYPSFAKILIPFVCALTGAAAVILTVLRFTKKNMMGKTATVCVALGLVGLLIAPAVWTSYSVFRNSFEAGIPSAGPSAEENAMFGQNRFGRQGTAFDGMNSEMEKNRKNIELQGAGNSGPSGFRMGQGSGGSSSTKLIQFLEKNNTGEKYLIAVPSANEAEPIILATGKPVMAVGGFSGNDKTLTVAKLQQMIKAGEIKYFLVGGKGGMGGSSDEVTQWVEKNGKAVDSGEWNSSSANGSNGSMGESSQTLYDLSAYKNK